MDINPDPPPDSPRRWGSNGSGGPKRTSFCDPWANVGRQMLINGTCWHSFRPHVSPPRSKMDHQAPTGPSIALHCS